MLLQADSTRRLLHLPVKFRIGGAHVVAAVVRAVPQRILSDRQTVGVGASVSYVRLLQVCMLVCCRDNVHAHGEQADAAVIDERHERHVESVDLGVVVAH